MNERGDNMQRYREGSFGRMEGEEITDEELAQANRRLRDQRSGKGAGGEDGVFEGDDSEMDNEETPET